MTNINHNFDNNSAEEVPFGELSETESNQVNDADFSDEVEDNRLQEDNSTDSDRAQVSQSQCQETQRIKKEPTSFGMANASLVAPFDLYDYDPLAEFQNVEMSAEIANSAIKLAGSEIIAVFEKSNSKIRIIVTTLVTLKVAEALKIPHSRLVERFTIPESARKYCYELIQTALNEKLLGLQDYTLPASHSRELERLKSDEDKVKVYNKSKNLAGKNSVEASHIADAARNLAEVGEVTLKNARSPKTTVESIYNEIQPLLMTPQNIDAVIHFFQLEPPVLEVCGKALVKLKGNEQLAELIRKLQEASNDSKFSADEREA